MAPLRATLRYGFLPAMLVGANAAALALLVGNASHGWLLALLLVAIVISFGAERLLPYARDWNRSHDDSVRDTLHAIVNESANFSTLLLLPVFTSIFALEGAWPRHWPFPLQVLLSVLILDLGITLAHFASHRLELLWRFHAVHHSVKRMYGFNGLMKHPIHQAVETVSGTLPLLVLGLPTDVASALVFAVACSVRFTTNHGTNPSHPLSSVLAPNQTTQPRMWTSCFSRFAHQLPEHRPRQRRMG